MFRHAGLGTPDLQALFNASPNPYVLMDRGLRIVGANAAYLRLTARALPDLVGRSMFEAFPSAPDSTHGQQLRQSFARVLRTGQPDHIAAIRYPIVDAQGRLGHRVWSATHIPLVDAQGQVSHVLQHTEDITHLEQLRALAQGNDPTLAANILRRAEASQETIRTLSNEREYLRGIFEQAPGFAVVLRGPQHVFEIVNAAYLALVGERELIGRTVREGLPELASQGFFELLDQVYTTGQAHVGHAVPVQLRRRAPAAPVGGTGPGQGHAGDPAQEPGLELRHVDFVFQPVRGADGQVQGIFVQGHDLTAQVQAEHRADVVERRFDTLAHTMPLQVWTARPDGRVDWCNQRLLDYLRARHNGQPTAWLPQVHPDDRPAAEAAWQRALAEGQPYRAEQRLRRHDGTYRWHLVHATPVHDEAGRVHQWVGSNTDIDDQKASAALLADLNNELARRVEERSAELMRTQEALRHSQQLEAIGSLAGGIAHEFNNLLQVIGGNLDLLAPALPTEGRDHERFSRARHAVQRGAELSVQLLAYSRRQPLRPEQVDLAQLVGGLHELLGRTLGEGVAIGTAVPPALWPTRVDASMLEHALLNLALNARDAMQGRGHLHIGAANAVLDADYAARHPDVQPGDYVMLTVTDTGHGMAPDVQARAFEPFFTTKPRGQGSGLGLSMVFGFAKQSGGHVKLYSEPAHGTTVRLYLPRSTAPQACADDAGPPQAASVAPAGGGLGAARPWGRPPSAGAAGLAADHAPPPQPLALLVVEDDESVRRTVVEQLQGMGHTVHAAEQADQALALLQQGLAVDVLFTDVVMPGQLSGAELAQRALQLRPRLQVLFTSGYPENALQHGGRVVADHRLLSKPYPRDALRQALADFSPLPPQHSAPPAALRVLLCEDDDLVRESLEELLAAQGCRVQGVASVAAALQALAPRGESAGGPPFDLLITDLQLPDGQGLPLVQQARAWWPGLSVAFASGRGGREAAAQVSGAQHIDKPFGLEELEAVVRAARR